MNFTTEATTTIRFPSTARSAAYAAAIGERYDPAVVRVRLVRARAEGVTVDVHHATGLGAEIRGLAYGKFEGSTVRTIYAADHGGGGGKRKVE